MKHLIPLSDFVLQQYENHVLSFKHNPHKQFRKVVNYTKFLKQPLTLGMFIPCDEKGNVMEKPTKPNTKDLWNDDEHDSQIHAEYQYELDLYLKVKKRVLFKEFYLEKGQLIYINQVIDLKNKIVEYLIPLKLELTPTAINQILK
jgi:hypothetical protein